MKLNNKIRELRELQNWSQEEMAEKLEMSKNGYARLERGEVKLDWDKIQKIAAIFQIEVVQLIEAANKGLVVQQSIGFHNITNYEANSDSQAEIEKLQLIVEHQKEIIGQKNSEIETLKTLVSVLQKK